MPNLPVPLPVAPRTEPARLCRRVAQAALAALACSVLPGGAAWAQAAPMVVQPLVVDGANGPGSGSARVGESPLPPDLESTLRVQLEQLALSSSQQALPGVSRVEIEVGQLDPRLRLAPCQRVEPYLPSGVRLWGRARIGLRCVQGPTPWNVYLPITVRIFGKAWVAGATLATGATLGAGDLVAGEVDWAEDASPLVTDPEQAIGRTLARRVTSGQGVRLADLKPRQWFAAGDTVKLVAAGPGFSISASGQAMGHGLEGQSVRVRVGDGDGGRPRVVSGVATGDRLVEVRP
ncbi:flagellar basal body P-ring formation chaperone FlgA [Piscinibacter sakaiensis]|nr:flagellar basal body P-ring formation chaperone FlgA [Piscinibacter sakaiensis]